MKRIVINIEFICWVTNNTCITEKRTLVSQDMNFKYI